MRCDTSGQHTYERYQAGPGFGSWREDAGRIRIGAPDPSLTGTAGMIAVTELCGTLGLIEALDAPMGPVKERKRGVSGGQSLTGMAAA